MKTFILLFLSGVAAPAFAQSAPLPVAPCGEKGVPADAPCLKDGKLVNTKSPHFIPHAPLNSTAGPSPTTPQETDSQPAGAPKTTAPKVIAPATPVYVPSTAQPAESPEQSATVSAANPHAAPSQPSATGCHDPASCFAVGVADGTKARQTQDAAKRRAASQESEMKAEAAKTKAMEEALASEERALAEEKTANDKILAERTKEEGQLDYDLMERERRYLELHPNNQQIRSGWSEMRDLYCGLIPGGRYTDLSGKEQVCKPK